MIAAALALTLALQPAAPSSRCAWCSSENQSRWLERDGQKPPTPRRAVVRKLTFPPWKVRSCGSRIAAWCP